MEIRFVVTPWRSRQELLELRGALYGPAFEGREEAVNKILAWRVRKQELPLLLESTADIVDAILQDEKRGLQHNALRMVYATAISRFITGLSDTQTELSRDRPSWFLPNQSLQFPIALRETRHCIVHRHLPSLAELKRAAKESLEWLWEWYWSHLDAAFATSRGGEVGGAALTNREARERLQGVLKSYLKERKAEIKSNGKGIEEKAAESAVASYLFLGVSRSIKQNLLLELLVDEKAILPAYKKLGTSMSGAFLVWSPLLLALCKTIPDFLPALLDRMVAGMCPLLRPSSSVETDPSREGMYEWCMQILTSSEWKETQHRDATSKGRNTETQLFDHILSLCFTSPTFWTLKLAETLLKNKGFPARESWLAVLKAAQSEDAMETVVETAPSVAAMDGVEKATVTKLRGPQKRVGLWRPLPIGVPLAADLER